MNDTATITNWNYDRSDAAFGRPARIMDRAVIFFTMPRLEGQRFVKTKEYNTLIRAGIDVHIEYVDDTA